MSAGMKPIPIEARRRRGNPGKRTLPDPPEIMLEPAAVEHPGPLWPLGQRGRAIWDHLLEHVPWIGQADLPMLQRLCEQEDDASQLRFDLVTGKPMAQPWRARGHLVRMNTELRLLYGEFGLTPAERSRLGVAEVRAAAEATRAEASIQRVKTYAVDAGERLEPGPLGLRLTTRRPARFRHLPSFPEAAPAAAAPNQPIAIADDLEEDTA